ncbi:hypothetical protein A2U01_0067618, partial [Trifolium medium]|nr:hypothetical protein [Trifolium medium]
MLVAKVMSSAREAVQQDFTPEGCASR